MNSLITSSAFTPLVLQSAAGLRVEILPFGATIISIQLDGEELTLRHTNLSDYKQNQGYLGATIGRYANRIARGLLQFDNKLIQLETAGDIHCLHGGHGFSHRDWQVVLHEEDEVELYLYSPDGDSGFPGDVAVWQRIKLINNELHISFRATTQSSTVLSLTNHCYFNLDGSQDITNHLLQIYTEQFLPVSTDLIPTGEVFNLEGSALDFMQPTRIADKLAVEDPQLRFTNGFDHCFVFDATSIALKHMATLSSPLSKIQLKVSSTLPGLQFYSGQSLETPFVPRQGLCLEAQHWPDAPNRDDFPSALLTKDKIYQHQIIYAFSKLCGPDLSMLSF